MTHPELPPPTPNLPLPYPTNQPSYDIIIEISTPLAPTLNTKTPPAHPRKTQQSPCAGANPKPPPLPILPPPHQNTSNSRSPTHPPNIIINYHNYPPNPSFPPLSSTFCLTPPLRRSLEPLLFPFSQSVIISYLPDSPPGGCYTCYLVIFPTPCRLTLVFTTNSL